MARTKFYTISIEDLIHKLESDIKEVRSQITDGYPRVTLMGHLYPEQLTELVDTADNWKRIALAIEDLDNSDHTFRGISRRLRLVIDDISDLADTIDGRETFTAVDRQLLTNMMHQMRDNQR